jgi:RHS repeat-associated protein
MIIRYARVSALAVLLAVQAPVYATYCVPPSPTPQQALPDPPLPACGPGSNSAASGSCATCDICSKSPTYLASGAYINTFTDLQIPTAGMYPLSVFRRYDSTRPVDGPLGIGWSSSLTAHLYFATYLVSVNTYSYEADIVMPSGLQYRFTMSGNSFVAPAGSFDALVKNGDGTYSLTVQYTRSVYRFNADGSIASLTDDYGNAISYTYDGSGRVSRMSDIAGSGRFISVTWSPEGRIQSLTDNAGRIVKYFYDSAGKLIGYSDPIASADDTQRTTYYSYITGRFGPVLSRMEDRWHRTITNLTWYSDGRLQSYTDGDYNDVNPSSSAGEKYTYVYSGNTVVKTDSLGTKVYAFSANGVANDGTRTFDPVSGFLTRATTAVGNVIDYTYNARGNIATQATSGGATWTYTYDVNYPDQVSSITSSTPSQWAGWRYAYNLPSETPPGALKSVSRIGSDGVAQVVASYIYDAKGRVTIATDANGRYTFYDYNTTGDVRLVSNTGLTGPATTYEYDALGRVTKVTTPRGNATSYTYDDDDRVKTVTLPSPGSVPTLDFTTRFSYDNYDPTTGLVNTVTTDPNGHTSSRGYDALGHPVRVSDVLSKVTQYAYQYNLPHSMTDANGNVTSYEYNSDRYLVKTTFFDGTYETYTVLSTGGVTYVTDRRGTTAHYTYDNYDRVTYVSYGSGSGAPYVSYSYVGQNLGGITDGRSSPAVSVGYTYDSQWRVQTEIEGAGTITYAYTGPSGDNLASYRLDPPFGQTGTTVSATMLYDARKRVYEIDWSPVSGGFTFAYNDDDQYTTVQFPNGQSRTFAYDNQGRLTSLANLDTQAHNLITYSYGYDYDWSLQSYTSLGNRTSVAVSGSPVSVPNGTNKYSYDANQQLTGVTRLDGSTFKYDYDAIGNRTKVTWGNQNTLVYSYFLNTAQNNTPRLKNAGGSDLTYDADGNLTSSGYVWDVANRLSAISTFQFQYDALNRRALFTPPPTSSAPVKYASLGLNTIAERSTSTFRNNDYLFGFGIDEPLARRASDGSILYYAVDGLGSVTALTTPTAQINTVITYDEWGAVTSGVVDLFGYTGREIATPYVSALWYYRARHYAPSWGRFVSEDPIQLLLAPTESYRYATNSPVLRRDPSGLQAVQAAEGVVVIGGTLVIGGILINTLNTIDPGTMYPPLPINPPAGAYPTYKPPKPIPSPPKDYNQNLPKTCNYPQMPGPQVQPPKKPADQCVGLCVLAATAPVGPIKTKALVGCMVCLASQFFK